MLYKSRHKAILTQCQIGGKTNIFKKKLKIYLIKEIERKKAEEKEILPVKQILDQLTRNSLLYFLPKDTRYNIGVISGQDGTYELEVLGFKEASTAAG